MSTAAPDPARGLDNVIALSSTVCRLSAEDGRLAYRGYDVRTLGEQSTWEETACLLVMGTLPTGAELRHFGTQVKAQQKLASGHLRLLKGLPAGADAMGALRAALAAIALEHPVKVPPNRDDALAQAYRLLGVTPTIVAAWHRLAGPEAPPLGSSGYREPSLVFLAGTGTRLLLPDELANYLATTPRAIVLVTNRTQPEFLAAAADRGIAPTALESLTGLNYSVGWRLTFTFYALDP